MTVSHSVDDRNDDIGSFLLREEFFLLDPMEDFTPAQQLHDHIHALIILKNLNQLHNIRMVDLKIIPRPLTFDSKSTSFSKHLAYSASSNNSSAHKTSNFTFNYLDGDELAI